ncbi:hypothetical protein JI667_05755 [Bacillus sp. NTK074B]|uniref:hypothetical protein n=1 Tax=Bacillus sp. NTK074B TaxID=2802174 RepID=UPI001A8C87D6|nr:hypothetical protein [Bacillus sp. NTK074B]
MYRQSYYPYRGYPPYRGEDQRFFPFFGLPFLAGGLAGLAISPFLFNRPCYGPACYPPYPPYGGYPYPGGYPQPYGVNNYQSSPYNLTENINIYPGK